MFGGVNNSVFPVQHDGRSQKGFGLALRHHVLENFDLPGREFVCFQGLPPTSEALFIFGFAHEVASFWFSNSFNNRSSSRISSTSWGVADPQLAVA